MHEIKNQDRPTREEIEIRQEKILKVVLVISFLYSLVNCLVYWPQYLFLNHPMRSEQITYLLLLPIPPFVYMIWFRRPPFLERIKCHRLLIGIMVGYGILVGLVGLPTPYNITYLAMFFGGILYMYFVYWRKGAS